MGRTLSSFALAAAMLASACGGKTDAPSDGSSAGGSSSSSAFPSCRANREGADVHCGSTQSEDCCASLPLPGGTFNRENDPNLPATLSPFKLDRYEVTVGRFRAFVEAYPSSRPAPGAGAHPHIPGSGWRAEWGAYLPADAAELRRNLTFEDIDPEQMGDVTWTQEPGPHERAAITCLSWEVAFAFCAWDGGRLSTEAEWLFAAVGGDEQRPNPWGDEPIDASRAVMKTTPNGSLAPVGSVPAGAARWGHEDFNGSRYEFVFDALSKNSSYLLPCNDCALLDPPPELAGRRFRDVSYAQVPYSFLKERQGTQFATRRVPYGVRCARD